MLYCLETVNNMNTMSYPHNQLGMQHNATIMAYPHNQIAMQQNCSTNNHTPWVTSMKDSNNQAQLMMIDSNGHLLHNLQNQQAFKP